MTAGRAGSSPEAEWFDRPDPTGATATGEAGLRFECTCCGNCCTGPEGFVLFTPDEGRAMAASLGLGFEHFLERYTRATGFGPSLIETETAFGHDCVFLDRESVPGKAVCRVYEARPTQCRTWPFWKSNLASKQAWRRAGRTCPGLNQGPLHSPAHIRLTRERLEI